MQWIRLPAALLVVLVLAASATAGTTSGRLTTSFYTYERLDPDKNSLTFARAFQVVQLSHVRGELGVHWFGQLDGDFSTQLVDDPKLRTYGLYFDWKDVAGMMDFRVGRHPVFAGVATSTLDGGTLRIDPVSWFWIKGFAGTLLPQDQKLEIIDDASKNWMWGGQLVFLPSADSRVGFSYFDKKQLRPGYETTRADSLGNPFAAFIEPNDLAYELGSIDATWDPDPVAQPYGRLDYDFHRKRVTRGEVGARSQFTRALSARAAYVYRTPRLPASSIFSIFDSEKSQEIEGSLDWRSTAGWRLYGGGAGILYTDTDAYRATVGVANGFADINYVYRGGYSGSLNGVNAWIYRTIRRGKYTPNLQFSWARYGADEDLSEKQDLVAGALGLNYRPRGSMSFDFELQYLHNPDYSDDLRFLLRYQYWFFHRSEEGRP